MTAAVQARAHWERVYTEKDPEEVSWFEVSPSTSLRLIEESGIERGAAIVDVGGGASRLAGELLADGYSDITVADISAAALGRARAELGSGADEINWIEADVRDHDFGRGFDLWHDRAVFHFMVEGEDRERYLDGLERALRPGGQLIVATFGPEAPTRCSGLPVVRYGAEDLTARLGPGYELVGSELIVHRTPSGGEQQFLWARYRRRES